MDAYVHNHGPPPRHPRTSSGISNSSVPNRPPPPHPDSRGMIPTRTYPGITQFENPQQLEQQSRYDLRSSVAATREELETRYVKDQQLQSLLTENLQLKSALESTNGNKESQAAQIVQLENKLQEERKSYSDLYKS